MAVSGQYWGVADMTTRIYGLLTEHGASMRLYILALTKFSIDFNICICAHSSLSRTDSADAL
jgi:hypothetical protein